MNLIKCIVRSALALSLGCGVILSVLQARAASPSLPAVIESGLTLWAKGGVGAAFDVWQKGGLLESDDKVRVERGYFRDLDRFVGNYKSYEVVDTKQIGRSSQVVYLLMNFERGAVYARFVLYRTSKDWVVQNMDFSTKPEAIMPWLAFQDVQYTE